VAGRIDSASAAVPALVDERVTVIRPPKRLPRLDAHELWAYRELLGIFVWRDLAVRYKQTAIGVIWAIFQPALMAIVYTVIFGKFAKFDSGTTFVFGGLLPMLYFSSSLSTGAGVLVANVNLVTKVYFPRLILPISSVVTPVVDYLLGLLTLFGLMLWFRTPTGGWTMIFAPLFMLLAVVTVLGLVFGLSAINVRYRDVPYAIPVFLQVMPFVSGVPYELASLPERWQWILSVNPMTTVIAGWRWAFFDNAPPVPGQAALGVAVALVLLAVGFTYFRSAEPRFADQI
jgi:lipopolysaccharide transport system permease protein